MCMTLRSRRRRPITARPELVSEASLDAVAPPADIHAHRILILDFGAQYTQLIARRVRELGVYCEIYPWDVGEAEVSAFAARGIILSGGPESVTDAAPPRAPQVVFELGTPVLGICYGMQTMAQQLGGQVAGGHTREFGYAEVQVGTPCRLLEGIRDREHDGAAVLDVWMSHGDRVEALPPGFTAVAWTHDAPFAAMADEHQLTKRAGEAILSDLVVTITKHLKKGDRIRIVGLGILQVRKRAARMGRNPATGEAIKIKASKKVAFRAAKDLKMAV